MLVKKQRLFCSNKCRWGDPVIKTCLYCGTEFREKRANGAKTLNRFCSKKCSSLYYGAIRTEIARIKGANERQLGKIKRAARRIENQTQKINRLANNINICDVCGAIVFRRKRCAKCAKATDNARHDKRLYRNGKPDLSVTLEKVYERDHGICRICNSFIIFGNDTNAGNYPSIDHIKPLSKGGLHRWDNVQLVCRKCNWEKGNKEYTG